MDWYALHTKPNKEELAWHLVRSRGFEVFYPRLSVKPVNPRARKVRPYFPGYMFVRTDLEQVGSFSFQYLPYAQGLVSFGGEPARVPMPLIVALQERVQQLTAQRRDVLQGIERGEPVVVHSGLFAGYDAVFDSRLPGQARVRVLLSLLGGRQIPVVLAADQIVRTARVLAPLQ